MAAPSDLERSIFRTLCWFSVFQIPLSAFETWKWLLKPERAYGLFEVDRALQQSEWLARRIQNADGMFALKGVSLAAQMEERRRRFLDASRKFRKLRRAIRLFQLIGAVECVCAANTMAWWHTTRASDIDLFIVTQPGRMWTSRLLLVTPFLFFGHRPGQKGSDPFCFSFFSTADAFQMESLKIASKDYYLAYWVKSLVPVFDGANVVLELSALNKWADALLPNARARAVHPLHRASLRMRLPLAPRLLEPVARALQRRRFPRVLRELANKDSRVVITDGMLKFHDNDRRGEFHRRFEDAHQRYF